MCNFAAILNGGKCDEFVHFSSQYVIELPYGLLAKNTTYCSFKYPPYTIYCMIFPTKK